MYFSRIPKDMDASNTVPSQRIFAERIPRMPMRGLEIPKGTEKERRKQELQRRLDLRRHQPLFMACPPGQSLRYVNRVVRTNPYDRQRARQLPSHPGSVQRRGHAEQQCSYLKMTHGGNSGQWNGNIGHQYLYPNGIQSHGPIEHQLTGSNSSQGHLQWQEVSEHQRLYFEKWNESIQQQPSYPNSIQWLGSVQQGQQFVGQPPYMNITHGHGFLEQQKISYPNNNQLYGSVEQSNPVVTQSTSYPNNPHELGFTEQEQEFVEQETNPNNTSELESIGQWYAALVKWCDSPEEWQEPVEQQEQYTQPASIDLTEKESDVNISCDNSFSV
ncbi:hypothetical protein FO519_001970 [Halicephalobus sp. NKZ332]|nr:hypothetical protein FO519_001970 [Halicephalobus sp. NKZ332]